MKSEEGSGLPVAEGSLARFPRPPSRRKELLREQADRIAAKRDEWATRHAYYYEEDWSYLRFLVPEGKRVLDLGCGTGHAAQRAEALAGRRHRLQPGHDRARAKAAIPA